MEQGIIPTLDRILDEGDAKSGLDFVIQHARETVNPGLLFEARRMQKRLELGLPLLPNTAPLNLAGEAGSAYDQAGVAAAKEAGNLALEHGNIPGAWPYFRAIGDPAPVAAAIEKVHGAEGLERIIHIAYQEGVHPAKGLELILAQYGMCRAINSFEMFEVQNNRSQCIALLVSKLHEETLDRLARTVEAQEGAKPATSSITELIAGRDWLFGEYDYYVDTSHVLSVIPYCLEIEDRGTLAQMQELCEYGKRLSGMFQSSGDPPFEQPFIAYGHYTEALLGINTENHLRFFREKVTESNPEETGTGPAQILVKLLAQLHLYDEAIQVSRKYLPNQTEELACPSTLQLCDLAKDYSTMKDIASEGGDLLSYVVAAVGSQANTPVKK